MLEAYLKFLNIGAYQFQSLVTEFPSKYWTYGSFSVLFYVPLEVYSAGYLALSMFVIISSADSTYSKLVLSHSNIGSAIHPQQIMDASAIIVLHELVVVDPLQYSE